MRARTTGRWARRLMAVALAGVVVIVVVMGMQRRLAYFPGGAPPPVEQVLPGARDVTVRTTDGLDLTAWWRPAGPTAVVVLPGNAGNRAGRAPLARALGDLGLSVLLVDYRGYGGNPGRPSEAGLLSDARAASAWVEDQSGIDQLVLFGESLGAAVAVGLATERAPDALVLRSPFTSLVDVARTHYGPVPAWLLRDHFPAEDWIRDVEAPVLVVASPADGVVPERLSRRLFASAPGPRTYTTLPDLGHNDPGLLHGPALLDAVATFLAEHGIAIDR